MGRFESQTVVITGAGSGIGRSATQIFLAEGATVVAADVDVAGVLPGAVAVRADVSNPDDVQSVIDIALERTGTLDVICNNAGIGSTTDVLSCPVEEWDRLFAVNVRGVFLGIKAALPVMLERERGVIVNTASVAGLIGLRDRAAYCATKGAVVSLTKQVAVQYAGTGVRCNCVCPGTVDSPWVGRLLEGAEDPEEARRALIARQPLGRMGRPEEIARAIAYLASDDAEFMTGTALIIDGGIAAG